MFSEPSIVKSEEQYREYISEIEELMQRDPDPSSTEGKRLELLAFLIEAYEKDRYRIPLPNPVDAILFRLEQKGLRQQALVPILGSKSRVSEVLSGKRRLTVPMIRALSAFLDIPVESLVADPDSRKSEVGTGTPPIALVREIVRRGWVQKVKVTPKSAKELVDRLFERLGTVDLAPTYLKTSLHPALLKSSTLYAIRLWLARVLLKSREMTDVRASFDRKALSDEFLMELVKLSWFADGPRLATEYLAKHGIAVVVEKHLPGTCLDGAATIDVDGTPVIGLTLRHDRLDNFWFTLLHECAHVVHHLRHPGETFVDDTETPFDNDEKEVEANRVARDTLIPLSAWRRSDAARLKTIEAAQRLANELKISPAIVAGRIRREAGNYKLLSSMVGYGCVSPVLGQ
jgi:HTH-type transcriptional regulator/antitoxin HigA